MIAKDLLAPRLKAIEIMEQLARGAPAHPERAGPLPLSRSGQLTCGSVWRMERAGDPVELAALVAAVSLAADLASGVTLEHGLRTCLLATRLAERAGLDTAARRDVYYASLLRSIGCTSDAHEQSTLFGNEIAARTELNLAAHLPSRQLLGVLARHAGAGAPPLRRAQALGRVLAAGREMPRAVATAHCQAAERLGQRLGFTDPVPESLNSLFERWDGKGYPRGLRGEAMPQAARFTQVAYDALLLHEHLGGTDQIAATAGTLYDPGVAGLLRPGDAADAADAAAALSVLSGQPGLDLSAAAEPPRRPLRIAVSARHPSPGARVAPAVRASLEQAADLLRAAGHTVTRARPPYPASLGLRFSSRWLAGIAEDAQDLPAEALETRTQAMVRPGPPTGSATTTRC